MKIDLLRRVKMMEYALRMERYDAPSLAPDIVSHRAHTGPFRSKQLTQPSATAAVFTSKSSGSQKDDSAGKEGSGSNSPRSDGEEPSSPSPKPRSIKGSRIVTLEGCSVDCERNKCHQHFRLILMPSSWLMHPLCTTHLPKNGLLDK